MSTSVQAPAAPPRPRPASPSVRVQVQLPAELVDRLRVICESRGVSLATLIRMLLYASLER